MPSPTMRISARSGIIRLCMLTGARLGEVRTATFDQFNVELAIWTKQPSSAAFHRIPISTEAVALSPAPQCNAVPADCSFLFPGDVEGQSVVELKRF